FSFTLGGAHSADLIPTWQRTATHENLDSDRTRHVITYRDPASGFVCEVELITFADWPAVDCLLWFRNEGNAASPILADVHTLDAAWELGQEAQVTLHGWRGSHCQADDFQPQKHPVQPGASLSLAPLGGRSSDGTLPFYVLQWPEGGACVAVGWSGQWQSQIDRTSDHVGVRVGLETLRTRLLPGESIRVARALILFWAGEDPQIGHNAYRQLAFRHYMPRVRGELAWPIIAHPSSYDELRNSNESNQLEIIRASHEAGMEGFWLDAYWFEGYFPEGVGNWAIPIEQTERRKDFPRGVQPISAACRERGLRFILWFEPERVGPGTYLDRTYPQWVLKAPGERWSLFNLGDDQAREWMTDYLTRCMEAYTPDVLRIDFNMVPLPHWRAAEAPDRQGMCEIRFVMGLYHLWDDMIARFPDVYMDNCASGGRRIDLETNRRALPLWRSDYNDNNVMRGDPIADQGMVMGLCCFMPLNSGPAWRTDPYYWRSANVAGPVPYWDLRKGGYSREELRLAIAESQALRPYALGDFWLLTENTIDPHAWAAYQYHRPEQDDGYAVFFRRKDSPYRVLETALRGVLPNGQYVISYHHGYLADAESRMSGAELQQLTMELAERDTSLLLRYRRIG
ncbi:MAG: hypothetical protein FJZ90_12805, partial [Chloroflexi bacterium]|nr:hypothetical protein [Chloroflexota bacterium]